MTPDSAEPVHMEHIDRPAVEVVDLSQEEYEAAAQTALADAGLTFDELAARARRNELDSGYLQALWYAVRSLAPQS